MSGRELDEDDVRVKRGRRTRPRSKQRPAHDDAVDAFVVTIDRGRITCALSASPTVEVVAVKARELGRKAVSVGDNVGLVGDLSGRPDTLARLVRIDPRKTELRRTADDSDPYERIIVANVDQMGIVVAVADPPPRIGLIDRCLVAAYDARVDPLLVLTKVDLGDPADLLAAYRDLDIAAVAVTRGGSLAELSDCLRDRVSVFVGHSGVGKSTLVNALIPDAKRATGGVNESTGRGRHTSTSAQALALPFGGWLIDTPGVRSFGLAHVERQRVIDAFDDLAEGTANCPRSCSHDEVDCGLDLWCEQGHASAARLESLRRILRAIDDAH
ncbi:MAG TPA: ribosome small subunit-dependent GTPase A [Actinobacteria bacterium]|nr:ribosome small subunit-dependent GTPase A [Actinomycetota bacterium]